MQITALVISAIAASASAATFYVDNACTFPVYLQSKHGQSAGGIVTLPAKKTNAFNTVIPGPTAQSSITVSRKPDLSSPLQAVYNQGNTPTRTFYDLSTIFGDPFKGQGFQLLSGGNGYSIKCPPRTSGDCPNTYSPSNKGGQNAVFNQDPNGNLVLQLCKSNGVTN